jgi:hypothetical protein
MSIYYHGTTSKNAKSILKNGFRRGSSPSYTGTGVNLTESMTIAYEYGSYENNSVVLAVRLAENCNLVHLNQYSISDSYFLENPEVDAVSLFGGNVIIVWNLDCICIKDITKLPHLQSVEVMLKEMAEDGVSMGYNGWVEDYRNALFGDEEHNLTIKTMELITPMITKIKSMEGEGENHSDTEKPNEYV